MEQMELGLNTVSNATLSKYGYRAHRMPQHREARFGVLMLAAAKDSGMFKEAERRFPKPTNNSDEIVEVAFSMPNAERRDMALRLAEKNGVTVKDFSAASGLPGKRASNVLFGQKSRGYLRVFGSAEGKCGNKINVYVLTEKGKALLERIGK